MYFIIAQGKIITDTSGEPRRFDKVQKARNYIRNHNLMPADVVKSIKRYDKRMRVI